MHVVSNSSPLINLARIGKLTLLRELFGVLIVPDAVWQEADLIRDSAPIISLGMNQDFHKRIVEAKLKGFY